MSDHTLALFNAARDDLDEHNDRRERLIKTSRDITALSKKIIFLLHRIMNQVSPGPSLSNNTQISSCSTGTERLKATDALRAAQPKFTEVQDLFRALKPDLPDDDAFWRYQYQVSPGLQEYIEALSFAHFLDQGTLISYEQVRDTLRDSQGEYLFPLPLSDYVLGLADLTGELMRYAITTISQRDGRTRASRICTFVRACRADFERLSPYVHQLHKKNEVTTASLQKIEDAMYTITVRTAEFDMPQSMLDDLVSSVYSSSTSMGANATGFGSQLRRGRGGDEDVVMA